MYKDDDTRIRHILDAALEAVDFLKDQSRKDLDNDRKLNLSIIRLLEIIGEAARGVSEEFRAEHPELPWKSMIGMRDRLIHAYFDVDLDIAWETVKKDLPVLINLLKKIIP